jgi:hypothetical protein
MAAFTPLRSIRPVARTSVSEVQRSSGERLCWARSGQATPAADVDSDKETYGTEEVCFWPKAEGRLWAIQSDPRTLVDRGSDGIVRSTVATRR